MLEWNCWILLFYYHRLTNKRKKKGTADLPVNLDGYDLPLVYSGCSYTEQFIEQETEFGVIMESELQYTIALSGFGFTFFFLSAYVFQMEKDIISFIGIAVTIVLLYLPLWVALFFLFLVCHCMHFITVIKLSTRENTQDVEW